MKSTIAELESVARKIRGELIKISHTTHTAHLGSSLSCVDVLVSLYWEVLNNDSKKPMDVNRDRFILSKGHAATTLYVSLNMRGFIPDDVFSNFGLPGSLLAEHPIFRPSFGIEATSGSLGHGLSLGLGMALASKMQKSSFRVYVLMSDGECNEGSVWEAALLAPALPLDNLIAIVDFNKWQATGRSEEITSLSSLKEKFQAFGWSSYEVDGHNIESLIDVLANIPDGSGKPVAIIANTIKGKGVSFMEDDNNWHYRIPNSDHVKTALTELHLL